MNPKCNGRLLFGIKKVMHEIALHKVYPGFKISTHYILSLAAQLACTTPSIWFVVKLHCDIDISLSVSFWQPRYYLLNRETKRSHVLLWFLLVDPIFSIDLYRERKTIKDSISKEFYVLTVVTSLYLTPPSLKQDSFEPGKQTCVALDDCIKIQRK